MSRYRVRWVKDWLDGAQRGVGNGAAAGWRPVTAVQRTLSKSAVDPKLGGAGDSLKGREPCGWMGASGRKFHKDKCRILHRGRSAPSGTFPTRVGDHVAAAVTQQPCLQRCAPGRGSRGASRMGGLGSSSGTTDRVIFCPRLLTTGATGVSRAPTGAEGPASARTSLACHPFPCLEGRGGVPGGSGDGKGRLGGPWVSRVPPRPSTARGTEVSAPLCLSFPRGSAGCPKDMLVTLRARASLLLGRGEMVRD